MTQLPSYKMEVLTRKIMAIFSDGGGDVTMH